LDGKKENFGHTSDKIPKAIAEKLFTSKAKYTDESGLFNYENAKIPLRWLSAATEIN